MELACPNCHMPMHEIVTHCVRHGMFGSLAALFPVAMTTPVGENFEATIQAVLEWPREQQERLYRLLHAAGCRI